MDIVVLGAGRVGAAIARDLHREPSFRVTAADRAEGALGALREEGLATERADLGDPDAVASLARDHDLVVGAVPGAMGFRTMGAVVDAGRDAVDISFFPEDAFRLHGAARDRGVRLVVDAGVAPGLSNLVLGHHLGRMDATTSFRCLVGGLPAGRPGPWEYRAPFSPGDVIEEYTRPARFRRDGRELVEPALSGLETVEMDGVGRLEAFLTDGLRTLLRTTDTPTLIEKTLRYPGHADRVRALRDSGFFDDTPVEVAGGRVRPVDLSARLLEKAWRFRDGETDLTVMRVEVTGEEAGAPVRHVHDLLDRQEPGGTSSMARTTGYTCTGLVRWLAQGADPEPGVLPPEVLARDGGCLPFVVEHLAERGVRLEHRVERAGGS